jgi:transglutaminase-like putative cysteine protease
MVEHHEAPMITRMLLLCTIFLAGVLHAQSLLVPRSEDFAEQGRLRDAAALLRSVMNDSTYRWTADETKVLVFELDRLRRIRLDYRLTKAELYGQLERSITGVTPEEFDGWIAAGRFDARVLDDTLRFLGVSRSNLFMRYAELKTRRIRKGDDSAAQARLYAECMAIEQAAGKSPYVLPKKFVATARLSVDSGTVRPGAMVRAWLPIPRDYPYQKEYQLFGSSSTPKAAAASRSPIRSLYLEQAASMSGGTDFWARFGYVRYGVKFALEAAEAMPFDGSDTTAARSLGEAPHIVFTDRIKELADRLVGTEVNPVIKARRFYDWISENIQYSYAREYSTLRNISDYTLSHRYGDCGQHALLYMTLCRYSGIPARWQSGWYTFPGEMTIHDWVEVYLQPYGWVPADPDMGVFAMQYYTSLPVEQRRRLRDFYFGGLDQYRMAANAGHCLELTPEKRSCRSDNVDFQRGEAEWEAGNIYFDRLTTGFDNEETRK